MRAFRASLPAGLCLATGLFAMTSSHATVVYSNNPAPGDSFTNATTANQGQAVGASGWYYNNVRNSGTAGISTDLPRSGTGSAALEGTVGPAGNSSKADVEYLSGGTAVGGNYYATSSLGSFADLGSMAYDWYRESGGTANANYTPVLRVLLDADGNLATTNDRGGLVYERVYMESAGWTAPLNSWVTESITSTSYLWNFGLGLGSGFNINGTAYAYDATLAEWQAYLQNAVIIGFSSGIGSGWGTFSGAVDNISWTIASQTSSFNFEVAGASPVPEPASLALLGLGLAALGLTRRRVAA